MDNNFTSLYLKVRQKENRIYTDDEVKSLPNIPRSHPHYKEWKVRERSACRLVKYLNKMNRPLHILEVGCGNGWFSAFLVKNPEWKVTGIDINEEELNQAKRVFRELPNLDFQQAELSRLNDRFDVIVLAASIQYFPSLKELITSALNSLKKYGEIHIIDSHLYNESEKQRAKERTTEYYKNSGFPEMAAHYFHHSKEELEGFNYSFPGRNSFLIRLFSKGPGSFDWVCIKATNSVNSTIIEQ